MEYLAVINSIGVSGSAYLGAGSHTVDVVWTAEGGLTIDNKSLFVMGTMR